MGKPMTRRETRSWSRQRLSDMKRAGIALVELLGSPVAADNCQPCIDLKGCKMEIELAVPLPLPGCDKKHCKCIWLARK